MLNNQSAAPLRLKVSTDFGTVNADLSTATVAGTSYTGATRAAPPAGQGILINLSGATDAPTPTPGAAVRPQFPPPDPTATRPVGVCFPPRTVEGTPWRST